ncbi:helix-turn-helix domain-containing protein [Kitasatospora sp. NPDC091207]|uniref:helix-turn-helix domain-containing protein n=1 Tax=Kitasatospora sp. NPDC091207 TaxID=3364083 RepID=UPI003819F199
MTHDPGRAGEQRRDLAAALKDLRRASGLSGERLAVRCGMSQSKISRVENGKALPSVRGREVGSPSWLRRRRSGWGRAGSRSSWTWPRVRMPGRCPTRAAAGP